MTLRSCIYRGEVRHKRLRPRPHALRYSLFSFFVDVDELPELDQRLRLFSYNRPGLYSIHDRDFGAGDGTPIGAHARGLLERAGYDVQHCKIALLANPRVIGYVFNPLSVYYCFAPDGCLTALIYEVTNTFGQRRSYLLPAGRAVGGTYAHACAKALYVSPFAQVSGRYGFRITSPAQDLLVAVHYRDAAGPLIKTQFKGSALPLSDRQLLKLAIIHPFMTLKITAAIHYEAARLWLKGIPLVKRPGAPAFSVSIDNTTRQG